MAFFARTSTPAVQPPPDGDDPDTAERRAALVGKMSDALVRAQPRSASQALHILRRAFSEHPLALRLAALAAAKKDIRP